MMDNEHLALLKAATQARAGQNKKWSYLLTGHPFTGKTMLCATAVAPILIYSFDPNGTASIMKDIDSGRVLVRSYSDTNPRQPVAFKSFEQDFNADLKAGLFSAENGIKTVVLDSLTTFADSCMCDIISKGGRAGQNPQIQDYGALGGEVWAWSRKLLDLPCDVILNAHIHVDKDDLTGRLITSVLMSGKSSEKLPVLFDEMYVTERTKDGYKVRTQPDGIYNAGTRMGAGGKLDALEVPDLKAMRRKCGFPKDDSTLG